jgi:uncharacterized protein
LTAAPAIIPVRQKSTKKARQLLTHFRSYAYNSGMSRPKKSRCVGCTPNSCYFKPKGIPIVDLEEVFLNLDELEAIRLADYEGRYHVDAAREMKVSRATFGRIVNDARRKVAEALIQGKALRIETGSDGTQAVTAATPKKESD